MEVLEELMLRQMSISSGFTHYNFNKCYHHLSSLTEWFEDGYCRVMNDFHVTSLHKDNFGMTLCMDGTLFLLQTRVKPTLLNAANRSKI
jgi:hypothetical protein